MGAESSAAAAPGSAWPPCTPLARMCTPPPTSSCSHLVHNPPVGTLLIDALPHAGHDDWVVLVIVRALRDLRQHGRGRTPRLVGARLRDLLLELSARHLDPVAGGHAAARGQWRSRARAYGAPPSETGDGWTVGPTRPRRELARRCGRLHGLLARGTDLVEHPGGPVRCVVSGLRLRTAENHECPMRQRQRGGKARTHAPNIATHTATGQGPPHLETAGTSLVVRKKSGARKRTSLPDCPSSAGRNQW